MKTLVEKFQDKLRAIDGEAILPKVLKQQKDYERKKKFNIYKRSLPPGTNKPVLFDVTEEDVERLFKGNLKPKLGDPIIYFDAVETEHPEPEDIYSNWGVETTRLEREEQLEIEEKSDGITWID